MMNAKLFLKKFDIRLVYDFQSIVFVFIMHNVTGNIMCRLV